MMRKRTFQLFLFTVLTAFVFDMLGGQERVESAKDTTAKKAKYGSGLEGPINYEAVEIFNKMDEHKTILLGKAVVKYQDMELRAAKITVEWDRDLMIAEGVIDSVWVVDEETGDSTFVAKTLGMPQFTQAGDVMIGEVMEFNFRSKKGRVLRGRTSYEEGFYTGSTVKLVKPKVLHVKNAIYTTCDKKENPHFHFWSSQMKLHYNDKVVGKPLVMYIGNIPVMALPFIFFPIKKGRHSGIILPRYGSSSIEGRYLKGFGYYWAASQYWDAKVQADFYERSGFLFRGSLRYNIRYILNGLISGSWTQKNFNAYGNEEKRRLWDIRVQHSQEISPTTRFNVSGTFLGGGTLYRNYSSDRQQRLRRQIISNATLTKRFAGGQSITVNLSHSRDLQTGNITETLPRINFRVGQFPLIKRPKASRGKSVESRWYHNIYFNYNSEATVYRSKQRQITYSYADSSYDTTYVTDEYMKWNHSMNVSSYFTFLRWFKISPGMSYNENWYNKGYDYVLYPDTNIISAVEKKGFFSQRTYRIYVSLNTKLYGLFKPKFLKTVMLRHVATPSVSFNYNPDFRNKRFGYYRYIEDTTGTVYQKYCFSNIGSTPPAGSKSLSFSLRNVFQMKIGDGEKEKKIDILYWNLSSSYNWEAEKYRLGNLSSYLRSSISKEINLTLNSTYSFYQVDENGSTINRLMIDKIDFRDWKTIFKNPWLRLTSISFNLNIRLKGSFKTGGRSAGVSTQGQETASGTQPYEMAAAGLRPGGSMGNSVSPWNMNTTLSYTESRTNPKNPIKTFWARTMISFNLTKNWKISYNAQFDFVRKEFVSQDINIYRDLHCWEARFVWSPVGRYKHFYFRINIKSQMLQDIKFEKGSGRRGITGSIFRNIY